VSAPASDTQECPVCHGIGLVEVNERRRTSGGRMLLFKARDCPDCDGTGRIPAPSVPHIPPSLPASRIGRG
jgi:DnaJ-class molecular chaperone